MRKIFKVSLARPGRPLLTFEARSVRIPGHNGALGIMAGRQPLLTTLEPGLISIIDMTDHLLLFGTTGGFCEMHNNEATLLCDSLITPEDIDALTDPVEKPGFHRDHLHMTERQKRDYVIAVLYHALKKA